MFSRQQLSANCTLFPAKGRACTAPATPFANNPERRDEYLHMPRALTDIQLTVAPRPPQKDLSAPPFTSACPRRACCALQPPHMLAPCAHASMARMMMISGACSSPERCYVHLVCGGACSRMLLARQELLRRSLGAGVGCAAAWVLPRQPTTFTWWQGACSRRSCRRAPCCC